MMFLSLNIKERIQCHPLFCTMRDTCRNTRSCLLIEVIWSIAYYLVMPYLPLYMSTIGISDTQIGFLASLGTIVPITTILFCGMIVDKIGRRKSLFWLNIIAWSIPMIIYLFSTNFWWFIAATIIMALTKGPAGIAFNSMLVEDAKKEHLVNIFLWIHISDCIAGFFIILSGFMISRIGLVHAVRILLGAAFALMTIKYIITYLITSETSVGIVKIDESKGKTIFSMMIGYKSVFKDLMNNRAAQAGLVFRIVITFYMIIKMSFRILYITGAKGFPDWIVSAIVFVFSGIGLISFLFIHPKIQMAKSNAPIAVGFSLLAVSLLMVIFCPPGNYVILMLSVVLDALGYFIAQPFTESLIVSAIGTRDRTRTLALFDLTVMAISSPFGWIAGSISEIDRSYPLFFMIFVFMIANVIYKLSSRHFVAV